MAGRVYFVGAGPGDPSLVTCRGRELLRRADAVLYDYLADEQLLREVPQDCEKICLGAHGKSRIWKLPEIQRMLVDLASSGKQVVRLKGGDPSVFGRLGEEIAALMAAEIEYEIVPGVTSALGAAAYADVDLTHREWASAVALVTGQETAEKSGAPLDYRALARFPGTLAIYMGVTTARTWTQQLIEGGRRPDTPVVIVRRATWPDQVTRACRLGELAELIEREHVRPPVVFLIGEAARTSGRGGWFAKRPLFGQKVLVTRPRHQADSLTALLRDAGAATLVHPVIEIRPAPDPARLDAELQRLGDYDWVVFSSANGVRAVCERLWSIGRDSRAFGSARVASIGPATDQELQRYHVRSDLLPDEFRAEALVEKLREHVSGRKVLLIRASRGREVLAEQLAAAGADVHQVVAYESKDVATPDREVTQQLARGEIDWITVTSSAIAKSIVRLWRDHLDRVQLVSISPVTSATLRELGWEPSAEARTYTMQGVVEAMCEAVGQR